MACGAGADGRAERLEDADATAGELRRDAGADGLDEAEALGAGVALEAGADRDALDGAEDRLDWLG